MAQIIKSSEAKIVTKNGECEVTISIEPIKIEITINVNSDGTVSAASTTTKEIDKKEIEKTDWSIPSFGSKKIQFGK